MSLEALAEISRYYGKNPEYILAGGGNTSFKDEDTLYVKGSGLSLADADADSFVRMDRKALASIWVKQYPKGDGERESAVLADMMAARKPGDENKRPSVEALLHGILPFNFVVHLHPALVNGLTCSQYGEAAMKEIFGAKAIWIPSINPGYVLSKAVKTAMEDYCAVYNKPPAIIFLQNHGVFVGDDNVDGAKNIYSEIMDKIGERIKRQPDFSGENRRVSTPQVSVISVMLAEIAGASAFMQSSEVAAAVKDNISFASVSSAFTPDHIVYSGSDPLFIETETLVKAALQEKSLQRAALFCLWENHIQKTGRKPKIVAVQDLGVFGVGATEKAASLALDLFKDTIKVSVIVIARCNIRNNIYYSGQ